MVRTPLAQRGHFRIDPLQVRTGDPFGFFEASAGVGHGITLVVYPRIDPLPLWRLPPASIEGAHASPERTLQTTPLATTVRPYAPGDSMNRIHWRTTARLGEIQVKEFELEQTTDVWLFLDLDAELEAGEGDDSTTEVAVRAAASVAAKAIAREPRRRPDGERPPDHGHPRGPRRPPAAQDPPAPRRRRGGRQHAARRGARHGNRAAATGHDRRRHHRLDGPAVHPPAGDPAEPRRRRGGDHARRGPVRAARPLPTRPRSCRQRSRAIRHALAEYELPAYSVGPGKWLGEVLAR